MDTSKEYILQCEKAVEIQELWENRNMGDFYICEAQGLLVLAQDYGCDFEDGETEYGWEKECIWLPRQDQLQEMIDENYIATLFKLVQETLSQAGLGHFVSRPIYNYCTTMEQLWLAFVMKEKYSKRWNGADWVKEEQTP